MKRKFKVDNEKNKVFGSQGFTILELLVVTAILGILIGIASSVFIGILRSQNKTQVTNEARQNAAIIIDLFERDIRPALSITPNGTNGITIKHRDEYVDWKCVGSTGSDNGRFTREIQLSGNLEVLTNTDSTSGVNIVCDNVNVAGANDVFTITGTVNQQQIVLFAFTVAQGIGAPTRNDYQINLPFETTVGTRVF
ncbi:MAG: type II secretion system protein [Candidatus Woykebacteria bacterium]